jgi:hypothetical protein
MNFCPLDEHPSNTLKNAVPRVKFDPTNQAHKEAYANWYVNGKWNIHFEIEWPLVTVPQTVLTSLANHMCSEEINKLQKKKTSFKKKNTNKKTIEIVKESQAPA